MPPERENPLSLQVKDLTTTLEANVSSAYVAAQEAATSFDSLPSNSSKTFIYTGNRLNIAPIPPLLTLGVGKAAAAHMMHFLSVSYESQGYK